MGYPTKARHRQIIRLGHNLVHCSVSLTLSIVLVIPSLRGSEVRGSLKIVCVQPIRAIGKQRVPDIRPRLHWPSRRVPEPGLDSSRVRVRDQLRDVPDLCVSDCADAEVPYGRDVVCRRERGKRHVPGGVQRRVRQLCQRCVEKVVSRLQCFDQLEWTVAGADNRDSREGERPVRECREVATLAQGLECLQNHR